MSNTLKYLIFTTRLSAGMSGRKSEEDLLHALMNDGVASSLADDEISPLNDDNRHEECCVARVLESLALGVRLDTPDKSKILHTFNIR